MIETAVDEVTTPTRNANARSDAMAKRITPPPFRRRGSHTPVFQPTISQIDAIR